jgi:hypothetical protein
MCIVCKGSEPIHSEWMPPLGLLISSLLLWRFMMVKEKLTLYLKHSWVQRRVIIGRTWLMIFLFWSISTPVLALEANANSGKVYILKYLSQNPLTLPQPAHNAVEKSLESWQGTPPPNNTFYLTSVRWETTWGLATLSKADHSLALPKGADYGLNPSDLFSVLLVYTEQGWQAALATDPSVHKLLSLIPFTSLSQEARDVIFPTGASNPSPLQAYNNYKFPWPSGQPWRVTQPWHDYYGGIFPANYAIDFAPRTVSNSDILASAPGVVSHMCRGSVGWMVVVKTQGTNESMGYHHLDKNTVISAGIAEGVNITQGQKLGRMVTGGYGSPDQTDGCGWSSGTHLHLYMGAKPITIDGVTFSDGNVHFGEDLYSTNGTQPVYPTAPYNLGVTVTLDNKVRLFWVDASNNETGFKIERVSFGSTTWNYVGQTAANVATFEDTITPGQVHYYRVYAYNAAGSSGFTDAVKTSVEFPVYRFWNEAAYTPFYTENPQEARNLMSGSPPGWVYQGVAFYGYYYNDTCYGRAPIYRYLWSGNSAVHFYGLDLTLGPPNWNYERVAFCAYAGQFPHTSVVHRFHLKSNANIHHYTMNDDEKNSLVNGGLWEYEGGAFYARSGPPQYEIGQTSPYANRFKGAYNLRASAIGFPDATAIATGYKTSSIGWQPFDGAQNAAIFQHGTANEPGKDLVRAFVVQGQINQTYLNMDGPMSWLGTPTSDQYTNSEGKPQSSFANGYIVLNNNGAQAVPWPTAFEAYKTSYFNNVGLWSGPALVRNEGNVNSLNFSYNWGTLTPPLPQQGVNFLDSWSVRWERNWTFAPGTYKFRLCGDDGLRLYLNNVRVIDEWREQSVPCFEYNKTYTSTKTEPVKVEYFQGYGGATISFNVSQLSTLTVVEPVDTGDTTAVGTLSYALQNGGGGMVLFNVPGNSISVRGNLPVVGQGVRIMGDCANPITIDGSHPSASNDGFKLSGNNMLQGLKLVGFRGKLLDFNGSLGNSLNCVTIKR